MKYDTKTDDRYDDCDRHHICPIHSSVKDVMCETNDNPNLEVLTITIYDHGNHKIYVYDKNNEKCLMNKKCDWYDQYDLSIENQREDYMTFNEPEDFVQK